MAKVVTANRLADGLVVYLNRADGWSESIAEARIADDSHAERDLQAIAARAEAACRVVDPYFIDVSDDRGVARVVRLREAIRAGGPTVQVDLNRAPNGA